MNVDFNIGTLNLPNGARLGICGLPGNNGELTSDLKTLIEWNPDVVLSMTEMAEMSDCGCANLRDLLQARNIDWIHIPISNFGGLTGANALGWPMISRRLHQLLNEKKSLLMHCRGGHGRSGMITLRLMVERGENAVTALERLRTAKPGAVETNQQLQWASNP